MIVPRAPINDRSFIACLYEDMNRMISENQAPVVVVESVLKRLSKQLRHHDHYARALEQLAEARRRRKE